MKKNVRKLFALGYYCCCWMLMCSGAALAYIDPSTTTYIIQAVAGVLIAVGATFTIMRHKIVAAWRKWYYGRLAKKNEQERASEQKNNK